MGTIDKPNHCKLNANLEYIVIVITKELLREFMDVFAWSYKEL
jgi:hypothetical protein